MPRQVRKDALLIFCLLTIVFAYFYQDGGWNGNSRFGLIFAIVRERRLTIDSFHDKPDTETQDKAYFNGHYYSDKAIGPALVGAVFYIPMYWVKQTFNRLSQSTAMIILTFLVIGLPSAIAGSLLYILCLYLSRSRLRAFLVTLIITLGTMYFPYSISFFSHQFTSSLLFSAFFMLFFLKAKPGLWKNWYFFLIGLLLGMALISEYPTIAIILALVIYYLIILWRNPTYRHFYPIGLTMVGGAIPVFIQLVYNKLCFGSFFSTGYANLSNEYFSSSMGQGLMGIHWPDLKVLFYMTFHPTMGVFWESPALLLSIIGAVFLFIDRRYRIEAILVMWIIGSYFVIMSGYYMWWGGYSLGPRHIIPVLPFFCVLLVFVPKRLTWLLALLGLVSIFQMSIAAAGNFQVPDTMVDEIDTLGFFEYSHIYDYCLQQLVEGKFARNLGQQFLGLNTWSSLIPFFIILGVFTFFFFRKSNEISASSWQ
jgi:hypothetical protein